MFCIIICTKIIFILWWLDRKKNNFSKIAQTNKAPTEEKQMIRHIGLIMDGNRRWAHGRGLPIIEGYKAGSEKLFECIQFFLEKNIPIISIYALTIDNFTKRNKNELDSFIEYALTALDSREEWFCEKKIRVIVIGTLSLLEKSLAKRVERLVEKTKNNDKMILYVLFLYSYLNDIAAITSTKNSYSTNEVISSQKIMSELQSREIPALDLVIRTGNVRRLSGFLPIQSAYAEILFIPYLWPDVTRDTLEDAIDYIKTVKKNFGA